ncbi:hypothetical protein [Botrimarina hoheduenensis]|uniref:Uncharacterized protein n=1 Tax=Botrimarina hoheduenensis TaxID=2528000 RepID=A0A5C5WAT4_9BACT|nr:hypothetical protein [Botrimarina hoheduenensis]TWT47627.1 hypothetical protein Pla111_12430 [Botrimarina hoheduenensis]
MRVYAKLPDRLVLRGKPGGFAALLAMAAIGGTITLCAGVFLGLLASEARGIPWGIVPVGIGLLIGVALLVAAVITLAIGRVSLTLDRPTQTGVYEVVSPIIWAGRPFELRFDQIAALEIETHQEHHPTGDRGTDATVQVHRLRLLLEHPRRVILLDETQNGHVERLQRLGAVMADWLGIAAPRASDPPPRR